MKLAIAGACGLNFFQRLSQTDKHQIPLTFRDHGSFDILYVDLKLATRKLN